MADGSRITVAPAADAAVEGMGISVACWSRAWTQMAEGLVAAEMAQLDLARSIYGNFASDVSHGVPAGKPQAVARQCLDVGRGQFDTVLKGCRQINDQLATTFFKAAETLVEGLSSTVP